MNNKSETKRHKSKKIRDGWHESFAEMHGLGDDKSVLGSIPLNEGLENESDWE